MNEEDDLLTPAAPVEVPPLIAESAPEQLPLPMPMAVDGPTVNLIPATPQGSQASTAHIPTPTLPEVESFPPPRLPRSRSQTPAEALLGAEEGRVTRHRSRSKTPI